MRALVTGGSGEIGTAICQKLAQKGWHVVVHGYQNQQKAHELVKELQQQGGSAETCCFDLTNGEQTADNLNHLLKQGPIQALIHTAGCHDDAPMAGMSPQQWYNVIDVSLNSFFHLTQSLLMPMMRTRWGRIIAMSSISAQLGNRGQCNYAAAKSGLEGAVRSLSREVASRGVTVNAVAPGIIETKMTKGIFSEQQVKEMVPMKRTGTPHEVAGLVDFLLSDIAAYITGQTIAINGGMV